jgi:predicted ATPase/class 3 adenylate cyclase
MSNLPSGTVTFLFTDIEGSTKLAREHREIWESLRERHHAILNSVIQSQNGYVFQIIGDAFCAAFHKAGDALKAAIKSQQELQNEGWGEVPIHVRMGIHTGEAEVHDNEYRGYLTMSLVQRIMSAGHGGQVLISAATQELLLEDLPEDISLRDLGERRLKDLIRPEHIYQLVIPNLPLDFPPIKSLDALPNNLPIQLTSFIGRERELGELKELMAKARLVTLTGVGGTGKTRLALQVGADAVDDFEDGVWLVELAPLADPSLVAQAVVSTLGLREQAGRDFLDILKDYLSRKNLLLVLDNCEHLIEACAQVADALLHAAPHLKILATSREALGITGESTYPVRSLSLPDTRQPLPDNLSQYDAVRLFIERAVAIQPNFQVTNQNAPAVAQVCVRLDGIPLAIELAAARIRGLGVEQITSRLDDRFRLLTGGSRTALPRQRTLQATIDWSYKLLSEEERVLLRRLSVFAGGWTLEAAEQVCGSGGIESEQILDLLLRLVDKSLVVPETQEAELRYKMLETIRQYAQEKLDEASESSLARDRHLAFFRAFAGQAEPHLRSKQQLLWLDRLETEHDNIRAALGWAQDSGAIAAGLHLATDLKMFWLYRAYLLEPCLALENLLAKPLPADQIQVLAKAHNVAGLLELILGNYAVGHAHAQESELLCLELGPAGKADLAEARNLLIARDVNLVKDPIRARQRYEENFKLFQEAGDQWGIANALVSIGIQLGRSGDFMGARQAHEQSLALFQACGDNFRVGQQNELLAGIAFHEGKHAEARTSLEAVLSFYRQVRWNLRMDNALWLLGMIAIREGDYARAKEWYSECLLLDQQLGTNTQLAECLIGFASIASVEKRFERAVQLIGAAGAQVEARQIPLENVDRAELRRLTIVLREELGEETFTRVWAGGRGMTRDRAIAFALEESDE